MHKFYHRKTEKQIFRQYFSSRNMSNFVKMLDNQFLIRNNQNRLLLCGDKMLLSLLLILPFILVPVILIISDSHKYNKSTYAQMTGTPYSIIRNNKGAIGEYAIYRRLAYLENQGSRFLFNLYLPKGNGETTECDVVLITSQCIIVFESKNYSGWIFGDESSAYWTQTLSQGKGRPARKERFYNPIKQNETHIRYLKSIIGDQYPIYSVITFSERCQIKKMNVYNPYVRVSKRDVIVPIVNNIFLSCPGSFIPNEEIERLYSTLYPYTQAPDYIKQQHIQNIQNHFSSNQSPNNYPPVN